MKDHEEHKLGQFFSTAICGNDILSSVLYVAAIAIVFAGVLAPVVLLAVAVVLFFYRTVYREVVEALPVNGGAYNALLNGTSKTVAATAGAMTILSYTATAVISDKTAVEYLFQFLKQLSSIYHWAVTPHFFDVLVIPTVIAILLGFAFLVIAGIKDSAKVALTIFSIHIISLIIFAIIGIFFISHQGFSIFHVNISATKDLIKANGGLSKTLFLGFAASLLGVSGFESSANFVEEQEKGVFKYTLRNMLLGIVIFNPLTAFIILSILPLHTIIAAKDSLLAVASNQIGGLVLVGTIAVDAFLVLCGAVLTAFVGVSGLVNRMTIDDCLPAFLLKENKKRAHPRIILAFFALCTSILLVTGGNLLSLAGVYTISFLGVMTLFAFGNLVLRQTRQELKRPYKAPLLFVVLAMLSTILGIIGNMLISRDNIIYFLAYFVPTILFIIGMLYKKDALKFLMNLTKHIKFIYNKLEKTYKDVLDTKFYVFLHHTNKLYRTLSYIAENENGHNITFVHCAKGDDGEREEIERIIPILKKAGAFEDFNIDFDYIDIPFGPEAVNELAKTRHIAKNKIFIGSIHHTHEFDYDDLGGVRIISA